MTTKIEMGLHLTAKCACGGNMVPLVSAKRPTWVCDRKKWWRFWSRKHAELVAEVQVMPGGTA